MKCAFPQPRANDFTISLDGVTLRNYACVKTSRFVNFNGEVLISRNESCKKIQPNTQAAHIHSSTKFEFTIDVSTNFLSTEVLSNPIPPHDYIGQIQNFATTTGVFTTAHPIAIIGNKF